jgi:hypothetical protein
MNQIAASALRGMGISVHRAGCTIATYQSIRSERRLNSRQYDQRLTDMTSWAEG